MAVPVAVDRLRERAQQFQALMQQLSAYRMPARVDKRLADALDKLLAEGQGVRAGIATATRIIDGANKWVSRVMQRDTLQAFPWAEEVVEKTAQGSLSAMEHFAERARELLPALEKARAKFDAMDDDAKKGLGEVAPAPQPNVKAGLLLVAALGALVWFLHRAGDSEE